MQSIVPITQTSWVPANSPPCFSLVVHELHTAPGVSVPAWPGSQLPGYSLLSQCVDSIFLSSFSLDPFNAFLLNFLSCYYCVCMHVMCMYGCGYPLTTDCMEVRGQRSPFSPTMGYRDQTQITRHEWQILSPQWPHVAVGTSGTTHMLSPRGAPLCH